MNPVVDKGEAAWADKIVLVDDLERNIDYEISGGVWESFTHWHVLITPYKRGARVPVIRGADFDEAMGILCMWLRLRLCRRKTPLRLYVRTARIKEYLSGLGARPCEAADAAGGAGNAD